MMYKRPLFSPFGSEFQRIATSGDAVSPQYDDGSGEEGTVPSGSSSALNYGKLLASGEAGYFDIANQGYTVARSNSNDEVTKPYGEGIDYHYPNPPSVPSTQNGSANEYWGLPSGFKNSSKEENYSYFQSGIFINHNDDAKHLTGSGLEYFNSSGNYVGSIFSINNSRSLFSLGHVSDFRKNFIKVSDNVYSPKQCADGINLKIFFTEIQTTTYDLLNDGPAIEPKFSESFAIEVTYDPSRLIPPNNFETSTSQIGTGIDLETAIINSLKNHLESFGRYTSRVTSNRFSSTRDMIGRAGQDGVTSYENVETVTTKTLSSGVVGDITIISKEEETKFNGDKVLNVQTEVEFCGPEFALRDFGTRELVMHHKGTGVLDEEQAAVIIPYLGDYKIVKEETGIEQVDSSGEIKCEEIKTNVEKTFEGE